jgi:hypothetical protein
VGGQAMVLDLLRFARDDDALYNIVGRAMALQAGGSYEPVSKTDYQAALDDLISSLESSVDNSDPYTAMRMVSYVDSSDNIVGRDFQAFSSEGVESGRVLYAHPTSGNRGAVSFEVVSETSPVSFLSEYEVKNGLQTGSASLMSNGAETLRIEYENFDVLEVDGVHYPIGSATILPAADAGLPVASIVFDAKMVKTDYLLDMSIPDFGKLSLTYVKIPAKDVKIPDLSKVDKVEVTDTQALQGLFTQDAMDKLTAIVEKIGISLGGLQIGTP